MTVISKKSDIDPKETALNSLQKEFDQAKLARKIEIFKEANKVGPFYNADYSTELSAIGYKFCQMNWHRMIYLINTVEDGKAIYKAMYYEFAATPEIWPTIAALKTIEIWGQNKTINDLADEYHSLLDSFRDSLNARQIIVAQMILAKM